jgi:hypothetical protein
VPRVAEALRHAARYGAFDHNAVLRIVSGKPAEAKPGSLESKADSPKQLEQYLRGTGVHQRPVDGYRKLLEPPKTPPQDDTKKEDDNDHGK